MTSGLSRDFEVIHAVGGFSRLTITPTRITLKITESDIPNSTNFIRTAMIIAEQIPLEYPALRGTFNSEKQIITMRQKKPERPYATFNYKGIKVND